MKQVGIVKLDRERPVYFGMWGLAELSEMTGLSFGELLTKIGGMSQMSMESMKGEDLKLIFKLIFCGLKTGADVQGETFDLNIIEVSNLVMEAPENIEKVFEAFAASLPQDNGEEKKVPAAAGKSKT